jgi:hypothetical protein
VPLALGKAMLQYIAFTRHVPYSKEAFSFVLAMLIESDAGTVKPKVISLLLDCLFNN